MNRPYTLDGTSFRPKFFPDSSFEYRALQQQQQQQQQQQKWAYVYDPAFIGADYSTQASLYKPLYAPEPSLQWGNVI